MRKMAQLSSHAHYSPIHDSDIACISVSILVYKLQNLGCTTYSDFPVSTQLRFGDAGEIPPDCRCCFSTQLAFRDHQFSEKGRQFRYRHCGFVSETIRTSKISEGLLKSSLARRSNRRIACTAAPVSRFPSELTTIILSLS